MSNTLLMNYENMQDKDFYYKSGKVYNKVKLSQIAYLKSEGDYIRFIFTEGKSALVREKLINFENKYSDFSFCRIHRGFIVNLRQIESYNFQNSWIIIGKEKIPVSRRRKALFLSELTKLKDTDDGNTV